jgi:hypothetical protein
VPVVLMDMLVVAMVVVLVVGDVIVLMSILLPFWLYYDILA